MYVLDVLLQDGKKIPKWNPWERLGLFLGFSDLHSSLVPDMGHISLQFDVIFDKEFKTVASLVIEEHIDEQWADIFWLGCECFLDVDYNVNDQPILPSLLDIIKSYSKARADQPHFEPGHLIDFDGITVNNAPVPLPPHEILQDDQAVTPLQTQATIQAAPPPILPVPGGDFNIPSVPEMPVPEGVDNASTVDGLVIGSPVQELPAAGQPQQNVRTYKDGPAIICRLPIDGESCDLTFSATIDSEYAHPVPAVLNQGRFTDYHPYQKL